MHSFSDAAIEVARRLAADADLPPVTDGEAIDPDSYGLDNRLTRCVLSDGKEVLLRQSSFLMHSPRNRVDFLRGNRIPVPRCYAAGDTGSALWEFVPGRPLGDVVDRKAADDIVWWRTGAAMAAVHAVSFPAPLQGPIGLNGLKLRFLDPVDQLHQDIDAVRDWVAHHRLTLTSSLDRVSGLVDARASQIREERPASPMGSEPVEHHRDQKVQLIDWDFPMVRYPMAELSALDEHTYLHGSEGLPAAFFAGYGREVSSELLLVHRIVGCLGWLSGDDWALWNADPDVPLLARDRLDRWHKRLLIWADRIPDLI